MIPYLEAIGLRFRSWFKSKNKSKNNSLNVFESWHILVFGRVRGYSVFLSMSQIMSQRYCEDKENPAMESLVVGPGFSLR